MARAGSLTVVTNRYGTEWRHWPGGCECHGDGAGYFTDYRREFGEVFDTYQSPKGGRQFLGVSQGDEGAWHWWFGAFSWTPSGDILTRYQFGTNATRGRAEAACREAVANFGKRS